MSKTIDEKVVEMRFDNKHFESNVQTTMSTLDKLKAKLNLTGASKGLENVSVAAKKVNMDGLVTGLNTVHSKFSVLETIGVGALLNIGSAAANAGKRLVASLSGIQAATAGFNEYSMTMNTVQTLVNSTGKSVKQVEKQLKELDEYADKTVYSTADMFNNIYKFTNAGVDLKTAKTAMIGIANATAYAGQGAQQASIAYYNLAQSMSMGYLTTIDYKSLNLANIATKEWKQRMADAAVAAGKLKKTNDNLYSTGKDSYTLQGLFTEGLKDQWATTNVMMDVFKQYGSRETEIGKKAWAAAQEVKTFGMMMESLQAQAGTGWKDTWQILFGSLDSAKRVWTGLANFLSKIIDGVTRWRNTILDIAMNNPLKKLLDKVNDYTKAFDKVKKTTKSLEQYQKMVRKIWRGDFKNQPYRKALVEQAGYNYEVTQSLVNLTDKMAGYGKGWKVIGKITQKDVVAAEKKYGIYQKQTEQNIKKESKTIEELTDKQLKKAGLTKDEIYMYRQLEKGAKKYGLTLDELSTKMSKATGRDLLYGSKNGKVIGVFQNIGRTLTNVFNAIKKGWTDVFEGITGVDLYMLIERLNKFTEAIRKTTENKKEMQKLTDTFKGLFAIIHLISSVASAGFRIAFQVLKGVLSAFNIDILDFTSMVGNAIYALDRWITENNFLVEAVKNITLWIIKAVIAVKEWVTHNEKIMSVINRVKNAFAGAGNSIKAWFEGLKQTDNIPQYIFGGLINGIKEHGPKVFDAIKSIGLGLIEAFKNVLGIHSPSKIMFAIGGFLILGLISGMQAESISLFDFLKGMSAKIIDFFKQLNIGNIVAIGISAGIILTTKKTLDILDKLTAPLAGLSNLMTGLGKALSGVGSAAKDFGKSMKYQGIAAIIKSIALSIGVLVAAILILGNMDKDKLKQGILTLGVLIGILTGLIFILIASSEQLSKLKLPDVGKILAVTLGVSAAMFIMAKALTNISTIEPKNMKSSIDGLIACAVAMGILIGVLAGVTKLLEGTENIEKMGKVFFSIAVSMVLISVALRMMSKVSAEDITKAEIIVGGIIVLLFTITGLNMISGNSLNKSADTLKAVGLTLLLLVVVMKLAGGLHEKDFRNGIKVIGVFTVLLFALMSISKIFKGTEMIKVTGSILMVALAIGALALVAKLTGSMSEEDLERGIGCVKVLSTLIGILILISKNSASLHGGTLIGVSLTVVAMGVLVFLLGQLDPEKAKNGLKCVGIISAFVAVLLQAAKNFNPGAEAMKTLIVLTVMLSLLAVALVGLSFIDKDKLMSASTALGTIISSLAILIYATGKLQINKGVGKTLLILTGIVILLAGVIAVLSLLPNVDNAIEGAIGIAILSGTLLFMVSALSKMDGRKNVKKKFVLALYSLIPLLIGIAVALAIAGNTRNAISNALALSILLATMTGLLGVLSIIANFGIGNMLKGVAGLTAMAVPLLAFVGILALMQNVNNAMENVKALTLLAIACTLLLVPLTAIGAICTTGVGAVAVGAGILALTAMAVPLLAFVGILALMSGIDNATTNAELLTNMMMKLTACLVALSVVAPLALVADAAILGLIGVITAIGALATAIGALVTAIPQLQDFLNKGLPVLEQIASSIGKIMGNIVAGFMNSVADELPHTGQKLSEFARAALPFMIIMSSIGNRVMEGTKSIASAILVLTGANLLDGIVRFLNKGESFERLGTELSNFIKGANPFIESMSKINPKPMKGAESLANAILAFTKANFWDSVTEWLNGSSDLGEFSVKVGDLGTGLKDFSKNLGNFGKKDSKHAEESFKVLSRIIELADQIPNSGGLVAKVSGDNDIGEFTSKLAGSGKGIRDFVYQIGKDGVINEKSMSVAKVGMECLKEIVNIADQIPNTGGLKALFEGDNDISQFADKFWYVGWKIRDFVWQIQADGVINEQSISKVQAVTSILYAMTSLGTIDLNNTGSNLEEFGARMISFANKLTEYIKSINTVSLEDLANGETKLNKFVDMTNSLSKNINNKAIKDFGSVLDKFGTKTINNFIGTLKSTESSNDAGNVIKNIINSMIASMKDKKTLMNIEIASTKIITTVIKAMESTDKSKVGKVGEDFVKGFADGINKKLYLARDAGSSVGKLALKAAKESIDSNSPSKETYKLGTFFDEGFIKGINSLQNKIYNETYGVGDKARLGLGRAIRGVSNLITEGIDDEFTIRPVLDLSDVESGAATLNSMFGVSSIGVNSNLNAISSGMRMYRQNSGENVVDAINRLSKNLGNTTGDTYNINGVTYDDGSGISDAVQTLVRAARIERRK